MGAARGSRVISALFVALATVACVATVLAGRPAMAAPPDRGVHEGVGSCAGSSCHSRQVGNGPHVRQDELITWQDPSRPSGVHSRAWRVLTEARAKDIGRKMRLRTSPENAQECLGCHTDYVPESQQSKLTYRKEDGVGCEACHGGSSGWLESHRTMDGRKSDANFKLGMRKLEDPKVRASVCLDCHFGGSKPGQFVTHEIMAAGHPRVSFELDLFSSLQQHWDVDKDYLDRKTYSNGVKTWAVGQAMAVERALTLYSAPGRGQGAFPEFYFFDCHSCHREIKDDPKARPKWQANPGRPIPAGQPPFNDENMIMLSAAAKVVSPSLGARFDADSRAFHTALAGNKTEAVRAAGRLAGTSRALSDAFAGRSFSRNETLAILNSVLNGEIAGRYTDYTGSAQAVMAADTLLSSLVSSGQADRGKVDRIRPLLADAYAQVRDPNAYRPEAFRASMSKIAQAAGALK